MGHIQSVGSDKVLCPVEVRQDGSRSHVLVRGGKINPAAGNSLLVTKV